MCARFCLTVAAFAAIAGPLRAQGYERRAILKGGNPDRGKCTIEVVVDRAAEVEIRGDSAILRNLAGGPPEWRRFECTGTMPANPGNFRFIGIDGRGRQELIRDPRNGGVAVVRIEDPKGGSEGYTFDLTWSGGDAYPTGPDRYRSDGLDRVIDRRFSTEEAVRVCQEAVRQQAMDRFRTSNIAFRRTALDDNPGRLDWVVGTFGVRRGYDREEIYRFSCSVNFDTGRVRSAEIESPEGDRYREGDRYGNAGGNASATAEALRSCEGAVQSRMRRDGYERLEFGSINIDNRPGRNDWVIGTVRADSRNRRSQWFDFSCSVNLDSGVVRSVDINRR